MILEALYGVAITAIIIVSLWLILPYKIFKATRSKEELEKITIFTTDKKQFNQSDYQIKNSSKIYLSLVVPSYNEQDRLPVMLK